MLTNSCRARQRQQRRGVEQVEQRQLPGNDASWFMALLEERDLSPEAPSPLTTIPETSHEFETPEAPSPLTTIPETSHEFETPEAPSPLTTIPESGDQVETVESPPDTPVTFPIQPTPYDAANQGPDASTPDETPEPDSPHPIVTVVPPIDEDDRPIDNTSEMVGKLWTARDSGGPLDDWEPGEMDRKYSSSRKFRWTSIVGVVAVIGLVGVGLVLLPSVARNRAENHKEMLTTAMADLRSELPDTQTSLAIATDPESRSVALNELSTQLTVLAAKASAVDAAAQADLPAAPPFTSSQPIDELDPIRQRLEPLGTIAMTIQRRISNLVEYRTLLGSFLVLPELPDRADTATQAELRVNLAAAQAESASVLSDLPEDVSLEAHHALAREVNERFATWQVDYLEALRSEDAAAARDLIAELESRLTELDNALVTPLAQIRRQTDADLIDLAASIDVIVRLANGEPDSS